MNCVLLYEPLGCIRRTRTNDTNIVTDVKNTSGHSMMTVVNSTEHRFVLSTRIRYAAVIVLP